jgi:hypothetical protein
VFISLFILPDLLLSLDHSLAWIIHKKIAMFLQSLCYERQTWFLEKNPLESFSFLNFCFNRNFSPLRAGLISPHLLIRGEGPQLHALRLASAATSARSSLWYYAFYPFDKNFFKKKN